MRELSILAAAVEAPSNDCLVADGRVWSFAEVGARVGAAIDALRAQGAQSGGYVAMTPRPDVSSAVWLYALLELGCPAVLLHPRLSERERAVVLGETRPVHVIVEDAPIGEGLNPTLGRVPDARTLAIVYTSGSRGVPRGAKLSRRAFVASEAAHASNLGWLPEDRWLLGIPPAHVGGLSILTRCLIARRCVVLDPGPFDPAGTIRTMERDAVTLVSVVPTMLRRLLSSEEPPWRPAAPLRAVLVGGAAFPESLRQRAVAAGVPALATYGCTEACSQVATQTPDEIGLAGSGAPLEGVEVRIVDDEIQVRGETLMQGYLSTRDAEQPWTRDGWLRTGDIGTFAADGQLIVRGRLDDLIVTGGENVAPQEVEAWLESVPGVAAACVFGIDDEDWGQRVAAAVTIDASLFDANTLGARMRDELATHRRPRSLAVLEALPLNPSGKVDRAEVRAIAEGSLRPI